MALNLLDKIKFNLKNVGKSRLDFSHPYSTTASFGDFQPYHCKIVQANSNGKFQSNAAVRFSTMLAPTFGKVKAKDFHHLVPVSDLFESISPMLAQSKWTNGKGNVVDTSFFPRVTLGLLSRFIMIGARMEIYKHNNNIIGNHAQDLFVSKNAITNKQLTDQAVADGLINYDSQTQAVTNSNWFREDLDDWQHRGFDGFHGTWFNLGKLNGNWFNALEDKYEPPTSLLGDFWIPIANNDIKSVFGCTMVEEKQAGGNVQEVAHYDKHINFKKCDYCLDFAIGDHRYTLCILLSNFGKRLRKQIIGSHKQVNMMSYTSHEIVTLCAVWKAYFDLQGITLYENYEVTPLRQLTRAIDAIGSDPNVDTLLYDRRFVRFILALGRMWYTEQQDAVGAMLTSTAVSPALGLSNQFIDVDGVANITEVGVDSQQAVGTNGHSFINAIKHGALDSEYLMKNYKWTNQHSVVGQAIAERLRLDGFGKFVDSCKSNFIGFHEQVLQISDVVSTSDTFKDGTGSMLGEYGGRGFQVYHTKDQSFSTDELSVAVGLLTIVPDCDYLQSIDPQSYTIKKTDMIIPEFDGMGFEAMRKSMVCGAINWASQCDEDLADPESSLESVAGLLPRGSHLKLAHAINNGDITLRSTLTGYLPWTLDRHINIGDYQDHLDFDNGNYENYTLFPTMRAENLPVGGYHYRYLCKYPWMGNFNRIFANQGKDEGLLFWYAYAINAQSTQIGYELTYVDFDNFVVHGLVQAPVWSPCKAIEESFETFADGEKPNASFTHA